MSPRLSGRYRTEHYVTKAHDMMAGAASRDRECLDDWISEISKTDPIITFYLYGFHIGCETAA